MIVLLRDDDNGCKDRLVTLEDGRWEIGEDTTGRKCRVADHGSFMANHLKDLKPREAIRVNGRTYEMVSQ